MLVCNETSKIPSHSHRLPHPVADQMECEGGSVDEHQKTREKQTMVQPQGVAPVQQASFAEQKSG